MCSKMALEYQLDDDTRRRRVLRKLAIQERTINELFKLSRLPSSIIKQKLFEINELIVNIPTDFGEDLVHQWIMKLARWWQQYDDWLVNCQKNFLYYSTDSFDYEIQKNNSIRTRIIRQFELIPPIQSGTDLFGLQKLFSAILKARTLMMHYCWLEEPYLKTEVFLLAISKLTRELCVTFGQEYDPQDRRQLCDLEIFVDDLLQLGDINQRIEQEFAKLPSVTSPRDITTMKCLLIQVSRKLKLVNLLFNQLNKDSLCLSVFNCFLAKLPPEVSKQFEQVNRSDRSPFSRLNDLRYFIANRIVEMHTPVNIGDKIKQDFAKLAKVNSTSCIDQIKCILTWASKARTQLRALKCNFTISKQLHSDLAHLALSKLPLDLQKKCTQDDASEARVCPLFKMIKVLSKCFTDYYTREKATHAEQIQQVKSVVRECASNGDNAKFCDYCHSVGHFTRECELIKSMTCFSCLQAGHSAKYCTGARYQPVWHKTICVECAEFGHFSGICPTVFCYRCNQSGHMYRQCTN